MSKDKLLAEHYKTVLEVIRDSTYRSAVVLRGVAADGLDRGKRHEQGQTKGKA